MNLKRNLGVKILAIFFSKSGKRQSYTEIYFIIVFFVLYFLLIGLFIVLFICVEHPGI